MTYFVLNAYGLNLDPPLQGSFKNHVDNRGGVGGLIFMIFVHVYYMNNVHRGGWVVKNDQNYVHVVFECPLVS